MRNHRLKASQATHHLQPGGSGVGRSAHPLGCGHARVAVAVAVAGWSPPPPGDVAGGEAAVKVCGVAAAMQQGHRWAPTPSKGSVVNVGTIAAVPAPARLGLVEGNARRQRMPSRCAEDP